MGTSRNLGVEEKGEKEFKALARQAEHDRQDSSRNLGCVAALLSYAPLKIIMSCCGGNCNCGSGCSCGSGCKMYPDLEDQKITISKSSILGVAPEKSRVEGFEMTAGAENGGCKCGNGCSCDPCNC
ncbi:hypothetical protein Cni_G29149 [Canna indica]|uniref:Metallothionein-like protein n=1 Tax=Canna indica TaxID=4628 RepID=A0AAQ3L4C2_9LILI|nr:hypothetical protein Cni_G29149 [Canna indica]